MNVQTENNREPGSGRFDRQVRFAPWGGASQQRLRKASAVIIGAGALGSAVAEILVRAGIGRLRIVDRDVVHLNNLHRQTLYTEADAAAGMAKVEAAAERLAAINRDAVIEPLAVEASADNIDRLLDGMDAVVDGTDSFPIRFVMNDAALRHGVPYFHGGALGCDGQVFSVLPGVPGCLRCLMPGGAPETVATCESAGVLMPVVSVVAALQAMECLKYLGGHAAAVGRGLTVLSLWDNRLRTMEPGAVRSGPHAGCPVCRGESGPTVPIPLAENDAGGELVATPVCGRDAVQVAIRSDGSGPAELDLAALAKELAGRMTVQATRFVLRCRWEDLSVTVFSDGRALVEGTCDRQRALAAWQAVLGDRPTAL